MTTQIPTSHRGADASVKQSDRVSDVTDTPARQEERVMWWSNKAGLHHWWSPRCQWDRLAASEDTWARAGCVGRLSWAAASPSACQALEYRRATGTGRRHHWGSSGGQYWTRSGENMTKEMTNQGVRGKDIQNWVCLWKMLILCYSAYLVYSFLMKHM